MLISTKTLPEYELRWELSESESLTRTEVKYCVHECKTVLVSRANSSDFVYSFKYELNAFSAPFNVTIAAVYAQPLGVDVRRSITHKSVSEVGTPGRVTSLHKTDQAGPVVRMGWDPPTPTNGPINYYRLVVEDAVDGFGGIE